MDSHTTLLQSVEKLTFESKWLCPIIDYYDSAYVYYEYFIHSNWFDLIYCCFYRQFFDSIKLLDIQMSVQAILFETFNGLTAVSWITWFIKNIHLILEMKF